MPNILLQFETIKNANAGQGRIRSNNNSHTSFVDLEPRVFSMEPNLWVGSGCEHFNLSNFDVLQTMIIFKKMLYHFSQSIDRSRIRQQSVFQNPEPRLPKSFNSATALSGNPAYCS